MKQQFLHLLLLPIVFLLNSCDNKPPTPTDRSSEGGLEDIKAFYYPVEELAGDGKVYEYSFLANGEEYISHYWHLQSQTGEDGNVYLIWNRYNPLFQQDMYIKEWIINDGVITQEYLIYTIDSTTQERQTHINKITQNVVFPFKASKDSIMAYRFECELKLPPDFLTVKLIRDRKFKEKSEYDFKGKPIDVAVFANNDLYDIENKEEGGFWNQEKAVIEIYGKNIGLIYQEEKTVGIEGTERIGLTNIYSIEEFEQLKAQ